MSQYGLPAYDAEVLTQSERAGRRTTRRRCRRIRNAKAISNWVMTELLRELEGDDETAVARSPIAPADLAGLVRLIDDGTISGKIAKDVFERMLRSAARIPPPSCGARGSPRWPTPAPWKRWSTRRSPPTRRRSRTSRGGKAAAAKALVGQVMKASGGKANPAMVDRLVQEKLSRI